MVRYYLLANLAYQCYNNDDFSGSTVIYREALKCAEEMGDINKIIYCKSRIAENYIYLNDYTNAFAESLDALAKRTPECNPAYLIGVFSNLLFCCVNIPNSKQYIEDALHKTETFTISKELLSAYSTYLYRKSQYLTICGRLEESLDTALEGLKRWTKDYPSYMLDSHYNNIVFLLYKLGRIEQAEKMKQEWLHNAKNDHPKWRTIYLIKRDIQLARIRRDAPQFLEHSRNLIVHSQQTSDTQHLIQALLFTGQFEIAKPYLCKYLLKFRNSKSLYRTNMSYRLLGDFYYCKLRASCNLPLFDFDFDKSENVGASITCHKKELLLYLKKAKYYYAESYKIAEEIDRRLECEVNTSIDKRRLNFLN